MVAPMLTRQSDIRRLYKLHAPAADPRKWWLVALCDAGRHCVAAPRNQGFRIARRG
jgi:hypothetical protein